MPISPTPRFFTMVHYLVASLRLNGALGDRVRVVVTVGADEEPYLIAASLPWSEHYAIEWVWVERRLFQKHSFFATAIERFCHPFASDVVMMLDADVLLTGALDELVSSVWEARRLAGMIALLSPFRFHVLPNDETWARIFASADLPPPDLRSDYTAWGSLEHDPGYRRCPPYFNRGVLVAPASIMNKIGTSIYAGMTAVERLLDSIYKCQIALTLAVERHGIPWMGLPMRFNCPNHLDLQRARPEEVRDLRILHYLTAGEFDKGVDMTSAAHVERFLGRTVFGEQDRLVATHLRPVHAAVTVDLGRGGDWQLSLAAGDEPAAPDGTLGLPAIQMRVDEPAPGARSGGSVAISGWSFNPGAAILAVHALVDGAPVAAIPYGFPRPDVAVALSDPRAANCGFQGTADVGSLQPGRHSLG
ncbi:MAG: hypothetical protein JOZ41_14995, partial [Chloroflexi bacterium]|nr:hypothetical protein [Chloroflexota bacterium]